MNTFDGVSFYGKAGELIQLKLKRLVPHAILPTRGTAKSAGLDLYASEAVSLGPGAFAAVSTGWNVEIPPGFEGQCRSRSGLAMKHGVCVLNSPGTIDEDYRGEMKIVIINHGPGVFDIKPGDRIAQLVMAPAYYLPVVEVEELSPSNTRGTNGFGSTGR